MAGMLTVVRTLIYTGDPEWLDMTLNHSFTQLGIVKDFGHGRSIKVWKEERSVIMTNQEDAEEGETFAVEV